MLIGEWLIGMIRIIAFLMAVMYGGTAAAGSPNALSLAQTAPWGPARLNDSGRDAQDSLSSAGTSPDGVARKPSIAFGGASNDPNSSSSTSTGAGTRELFFKMMLSVLLVVGLGAAAIYASRRLVSRITNPPGKRIKVVETAYLGPRKAVHLLRIGDRWILVGSTNENITKLAELTSDAVTQDKLFAEGRGRAESQATGPVGDMGLCAQFAARSESGEVLMDLSAPYREKN
jgi:flagellar biosynthetic protein FliO